MRLSQGEDEGGPAFAFGQLTSSLPEPLTFGSGAASEGPSARCAASPLLVFSGIVPARTLSHCANLQHGDAPACPD